MKEFLGISGGAVPLHQAPEVIQDAVRGDGPTPETKDEQKMRDRLAALGYDITVYKTKSCPAFVKGDGNSSPGGTAQWVETKNPWPKCMEQMGYQFVTENGYCYPNGMACYAQDDVKGTTKKTIDVAQNWIELARIYNSVQQKEFDEWYNVELARVNSSMDTAGLSEQEKKDLILSHMPPEFRGVPKGAVVQSMVTIAAELENAVSELSSSNDVKQRRELMDLLRSTRTMAAQWESANHVFEQQNLERTAEQLVNATKECITVSEQQKKMPGKVLYPTQNCQVLDLGTEQYLMPTQVRARLDTDAVAKGGPVDPLVTWWRRYNDLKSAEDQKKFGELKRQLAPTRNAELIRHNENPDTILQKNIARAIGPGVSLPRI